MNESFLFLISAAVLALIAGTLRSIKQNLVHRPAAITRMGTIAWVDLLESFLWFCCAFAVVIAAPHPVVIVLVSLLIVSVVTARSLQYREEKRSLNRWLRMAADSETPIPELLDSLADGCRSRLARQAKRCTKRLFRGESIADAVRRSKLPLDADTLAAIIVPQPTVAAATDSGGWRHLRGDARVLNRRDQDSSKSNSMLFQQFTYVAVTMFLACLIGMLVRFSIVPMVEDLFNEFSEHASFSSNLSLNALETIGLIANVIAIGFVVWLVLAGDVRWLPAWMVAWIPWFGRRAIDQWRCEIFETLGRGMRVDQSVGQILLCLAGTSRVRWVRSRCRLAQGLVESGTPLPTAMRRAKWVNAREQTWFACAEKNGTLPDAIEKLGDDIRRHLLHRWRMRMAWFVPLATVLIGGYVLAHAMFLFQFLLSIINGLAY